jgi:hypothetical protein
VLLTLKREGNTVTASIGPAAAPAGYCRARRWPLEPRVRAGENGETLKHDHVVTL